MRDYWRDLLMGVLALALLGLLVLLAGCTRRPLESRRVTPEHRG